jgi:hypothetical protein
MSARVAELLGDLNVLANPLFVKSVRQRLRMRELIAWCTVTVLITTLVFVGTYFTATERHIADPAAAARAAFVPVMFIQGFILILLGTGSVASGITVERMDGTLDYHRMTPMSPTAKILGYLFGLPVREYVMFLTTLPFVLICVVKGGLSVVLVAELYLVFFVSVWLYHMTGMVAGMIARRPRRAGWFARLMVIALYLFFPRFASFGFTFLGHLTFLPAWYAIMAGELQLATRGVDLARYETVRFFTVALRPTLYSLLVQGGLLFCFFSIVRRKWLQATHHAFSKGGALLFHGAVQLLVLGSLWPFLTGQRSIGFVADGVIQLRHQWAGVFYCFFFISVLSGLVLIHSITPSRSTFQRGLRRARKLGWRRVPWSSDEAGGLLPALLLGAITLGSYLALVYLGLPDEHLRRWNFYATGHLAVAALVLATHQLVYVSSALWGTRGLVAITGLLWLFPLAVAFILVSAWSAVVPASYVATLSPAATYLYAVLYLFDLFAITTPQEPFQQIPQHLGPLLTVSVILNVAIGLLLLGRLRRVQRELARPDCS